MPHATHLAELARQVRGDTLRFLNAVPDSWLTWAPAGTSNHILWHAGHAVWLQDVLCVGPMTGQSELTDGWAETFGARCRPVAETEHWPSRDEVSRRLEEQLQRLLEILHSNASAKLARPDANAGPGRGLLGDIVHGLHDEAKHQGEMYLLMKLRRAASAMENEER